MPIQTGLIIARDIKIYAGGNKIANVTEGNLTINADVISTTAKDSGGWETGKGGKKSFELSISALAAFDAAFGLSYLFAAWLAGTKLTVVFRTETNLNEEYAGDTYITSIGLTAGVQDNVTLSVNFKGTGSITKAVTPVLTPLNPATAIILSDKMALYLGGAKIGNLTNVQLNLTADMIDITNKDSNGWAECRPGKKSWDMSCDAFFSYDSPVSFDEMFSSLTGGASSAVYFGSSVTGDKKYSGDAIITSVAAKAGVDDMTTYTANLKGTGPIAEATV